MQVSCTSMASITFKYLTNGELQHSYVSGIITFSVYAKLYKHGWIYVAKCGRKANQSTQDNRCLQPADCDRMTKVSPL